MRREGGIVRASQIKGNTSKILGQQYAKKQASVFTVAKASFVID